MASLLRPRVQHPLHHPRLAALLQRLSWTLEAFAIGVFWWVCGKLPPDVAAAFGRALMSRIGPRIRKNQHVPHNLALACPDQSDAALTRLVADVWGGLGAALAEYPHLGRICVTEASRRIQFRGIERIEALLEEDRSAVLVPAHLANWEIPTAAALQTGLPLTILHTPQKNPLIARRLEQFRRPLGCEYLPKTKGLRELVRVLERGRSIAILPDIRVDSGAMVTMFGVEVPTTLIPARLALRFGCDLIPVRIERLGGCQFRVSVEAPVVADEPSADERTQAIQMMTKLNALFETWIRERPSQWVCPKRRDFKPNHAAMARARSSPEEIPPGLATS